VNPGKDQRQYLQLVGEPVPETPQPKPIWNTRALEWELLNHKPVPAASTVSHGAEQAGGRGP
jgi:hypothetical protein